MPYQYTEFQPEKYGYVRLEKVKCGKPNCHCANDKKHKAYYHYYRDYLHRDVNGKPLLRKKHIPKSSVKELRRKIQLKKNLDNLPNLFNNDNPFFVSSIWQKLEKLPRSKMIEKFHTEVKRAKIAFKDFDVPILDV